MRRELALWWAVGMCFVFGIFSDRLWLIGAMAVLAAEIWLHLPCYAELARRWEARVQDRHQK
jgi:hypothetical protein